MTHYLHFYELTKAPFSPSPATEFPYWNPARQELRRTFGRAIAERKGLLMLTGEEGIGKTTLLLSVLESAARQPLKVIFASLDATSPHRLFSTLIRELAQDAPTQEGVVVPVSQPVLETSVTEDEGHVSFSSLPTLLLREYQRGVTVVLVIDDAHTSSVQSLLQLCRLTKLRVEGKALVQIILAGRPALARMVDSPRLWQLRRQLTVRATVAPLSTPESQAYLHRRLAVVASGETPIVWTEGITLLAQHGHGNPRLLNMLGHEMLSAGLAAQQRPITTALVRQVLPTASQHSLERTLISRSWSFLKKAAGVAIAIGGMTTLSIAGASYLRSESSSPVSAMTQQPVVVDGANVLAIETPAQERTAETDISQQVVTPPEQPSGALLPPSVSAPASPSPNEPIPAANQRMRKLQHSAPSPEKKVTKAAKLPVVKSSMVKPQGKKPQVVKPHVRPLPQQQITVRHSSPPRKTLLHQRAGGGASSVKTSTRKKGTDRLFDE